MNLIALQKCQGYHDQGWSVLGLLHAHLLLTLTCFAPCPGQEEGLAPGQFLGDRWGFLVLFWPGNGDLILIYFPKWLTTREKKNPH